MGCKYPKTQSLRNYLRNTLYITQTLLSLRIAFSYAYSSWKLYRCVGHIYIIMCSNYAKKWNFKVY